MDDEAELIVRLQQNDERALRELYDRLANNVFALAKQMLWSIEDAEEIVQDTFVNVYESADRFDPAKGSARAWIYTIARNACKMRLRAKDSRPQKQLGVDLHEPGVALAAPQLGASHVDRLTVQQAFDHLEDDEVEFLQANFFDGYTHDEIAERTGTPLGTVKSRIRRAMVKVRDFLADT